MVTIGMGEVIGLNLSAVYALMSTLGVPKHRELETIDKLIVLHDTLFPIKKPDSEQEQHGQRTDTTFVRQL